MTVLVVPAAIIAGIATVPAAIVAGVATIAPAVITTVTTAMVAVVAARIIVHCYQAVLLGIISVVITAPVSIVPACIGPVITATTSVATEEKIEKAETTAIVITIITHLNFFP